MPHKKPSTTKPPAPMPPAPADNVKRDISGVYGPLGYLKELFMRFGADQCGSWAASLSFFAILSIAPILLCALAVLGFLIHNPHEATLQVQRIIASLLPGDSVQSTARDLVAQMQIEKSAETLMASRGVAGIVGVASLFWAALQIFVNAVAPMNAALRATETRNFLKLRLAALGLLFGAGILFVLSLLPAIGAEFIGKYVPSRLPDSTEAIVSTLLYTVSLLVGVAINAVMFAVIYRYLPSPSARVDWRSAAFSGVIVAALWEIAKRAFGFYLSHYGNYNKVYGSLGGLVALIFWIYYSSMILLLGAEIAGLYMDARTERQRKARTA